MEKEKQLQNKIFLVFGPKKILRKREKKYEGKKKKEVITKIWKIVFLEKIRGKGKIKWREKLLGNFQTRWNLASTLLHTLLRHLSTTTFEVLMAERHLEATSLPLPLPLLSSLTKALILELRYEVSMARKMEIASFLFENNSESGFLAAEVDDERSSRALRNSTLGC